MLLDGARACEGAWKKAACFFVGLWGMRSDAARSCGVPVGLAGVALVADDGAGLNVGSYVEQV